MDGDPHSRTPPQKAFAQFVECLTKAQIDWLVLRNYDQPLGGRDIDFFLRPECVSDAIGLLLKSAKTFGGTLLHVYRRHHLVAVYMLFRDDPLPLHIDFYHGAFSWAGVEYLSHDEVIAARQEHSGIPIPAPHHEAAVLLLASLLDGGFLKAKYLPRVRELLDAPTSRQAFQNQLQRAFGDEPVADLLDLAHETSPSNESAAHALSRTLRKELVTRSLRRKLMTALRALCSFALSEVSRFAFPAGPVIAITGPDGAGKSTILSAIQDKMNPWITAGPVFHWRPSFLRDAGVAAGKRAASPAGVNPDPHGKPPHCTLLSMARLLYYWLDYWLGHFLLVRRVQARNRVVFFDRYAIDMVVDPRRFRFRLPNRVLRVASSTVPRPDLFIALVAPGEVLVARKPEVSVEVAQQLSDSYRDAAARFKNGHVVDASQPLDAVVDEVFALILESMAQKAAARLPSAIRSQPDLQ